MKLNPALVILIFATSLTSCSPQTKTNAEIQKIVDEFFQSYEINGHRKAVVALLSQNRWITNADADNVVNKMDEIVSQIGTYYGREKVSENSYGSNIVQYVYIVKYERQPLKFIFKFYKANDQWQMQSFNYEVEFMQELDEAGKAYRSK